MKAILFSGSIGLVLSLLGTRSAITILARAGYGQEIRDDGPTSHHTKRGTPTMGGIVIVVAAVIAYFGAKVLTRSAPSASALLLLFLFVGMGIVGFLDDFIKIVKQRSLGLRSKAKVVGQAVVALSFALVALSPQLADSGGRTPAAASISFLRDLAWAPLPMTAAVIVIWFIVTAESNAVNLTDGLDGLATGASVMVFGAYTLIGIWQNNQSCALNPVQANCYNVRDPLDLAVVSAAITGACFGFLWWNAPPARIFMGDTGSLSLGAALAGLAVLTRTELLLILLGGLFVAITLSVIIQVAWFKGTRRVTGVGKRLFRMAPLQHHFEMLGWDQVTIVIRFWIITGLCVAAGIGVFYAEWVARS
ncbi:MAG: phospho-N-acetylmuramoyl-pentapeptide-transferase [Nocardioides sp.]